MKVDLAALLQRYETAEFMFELDPLLARELPGVHSIEIPSPVTVKAQSVEGAVLLRFEADLTLEMECSRCLNYFPLNIIIDQTTTCFPKQFEHDPEQEQRFNGDEDVIFFDEQLLDLNEIVASAIALTLPMSPICSEECKGLCPLCGHQLNESNCECQKPEIDPRLENLKNLLNR